MRGLEHDIKSFLKSKMLNVKEDILAGNASVKRTVKVLVEVNPRFTEDSWEVRIEGRVEDNIPEMQSTKLLSVFERVKVEFTKKDGQAPYLPVQWTKSKTAQDAAFEGISIVRKYPPADQVTANISFYLDHSPHRFRLSDSLQKVLGITEESRARVVAALWQYIKNNRLQDPEERRIINLNEELQAVFGAEEKVEFHRLLQMLKPHLLELKPLTITVPIKRDQELWRRQYAVPVAVQSKN